MCIRDRLQPLGKFSTSGRGGRGLLLGGLHGHLLHLHLLGLSLIHI